MKKKDEREFRQFCQQATDAQVLNIYQKEKEARRGDYMWIAKEEALKRRLL
jgi:hypothetical protein